MALVIGKTKIQIQAFGLQSVLKTGARFCEGI